MKTEHLHMRCSPALKEALAAAARRKQVDVSSLVSMVLADYLERDGHPVEPANDAELAPKRARR